MGGFFLEVFALFYMLGPLSHAFVGCLGIFKSAKSGEFQTGGDSKRESPSVSATVPLELGDTGASVVTNLLRNGGTARIESRLDTAGRLTATVYTRKGKLLRNLADEEISMGVHVIEWDGRNAAGELVSPGMFVLVVTVNGHAKVHKIIVQG